MVEHGPHLAAAGIPSAGVAVGAARAARSTAQRSVPSVRSVPGVAPRARRRGGEGGPCPPVRRSQHEGQQRVRDQIDLGPRARKQSGLAGGPGEARIKVRGRGSAGDWRGSGGGGGVFQCWDRPETGRPSSAITSIQENSFVEKVAMAC